MGRHLLHSLWCCSHLCSSLAAHSSSRSPQSDLAHPGPRVWRGESRCVRGEAVAESTGCQARRQPVAAWGAGGRTWQQEGGSQRWLKVTCWGVSGLELSLLLQNNLLDWDPSCPCVLLFSLGVYVVALLPGTLLPTSCCCSAGFWKMGISSVCPRGKPSCPPLPGQKHCLPLLSLPSQRQSKGTSA